MNSSEVVANTDALEEAVNWFMRLRSDTVRDEDRSAFERWTRADVRHASAYQQIVGSWDSVGQLAEAPQILAGRREALAAAPASSRRRLPRLLAAAALVLAVGVGVLWVSLPVASVYSTARGEERTVRLSDGSIIALDADSQVRVRYGRHERDLVLERGQARFSVAKNPLRPFRVHARDKTVVALGTQFDVDLSPHGMSVTLLEGHVAISGVPADHSAAPHVVELSPGEALNVCDNGDSRVTTHVDVARVTAWQSGKIFFDNEPLWSAVARFSRYAPQHLAVDSSVSHVMLSGVFNTGNPSAFIDAITHYFPIDAVQVSNSEIVLTERKSDESTAH